MKARRKNTNALKATSAAVGLSVVMVISAEAEGKARGGPDFDGDGFEDLVINAPYEDLVGEDSAGAVHVLYGGGNGPKVSGNQFWHQDSSGVNESVGTDEWFGYECAWGDFDDDGFDDLAIGVPGESVNGYGRAGGVAVFYGSSNGLRSSGDQFFTQDSPGMNDASFLGEYMGDCLSVGDFDGDGFDDLAVGVPLENVGGAVGAGAVQVIYGGNNGLSSSGDQVFTQESSGVAGTPETNDHFGEQVESGDFDGDGKDDLAIGVPGEDIETPVAISNCGLVNVIYGSSSGLKGDGGPGIDQNFLGTDLAGADDQFGTMLASGDFDGNGKDDLAIGAHRDSDFQAFAGEVDVVYGSSGGLNLNNTERWGLDGGAEVNDLPGTAAVNDQCGGSLVSGDFDGDGRDDLAIGVIGRDVGGVNAAGAVIVVLGGSNGLREGTAKTFHEDTNGMNDSAEAGDAFGYGFMAGDFDDDGRDDLAIGVVGEEVAGFDSAGSVHLIFGGSNGLTSSGDKIFTQDTAGIRDRAQLGDLFGQLNGI